MSIEEINRIAIINSIFNAHEFLRFMISLKYGLVSLRYSVIDTVLFPLPLHSYWKELLLKNLPILPGFLQFSSFSESVLISLTVLTLIVFYSN